MKRLNGSDAMFLYGETLNVHQHTLKVAVLDTSGYDGAPTIQVARELLRRRLHLLDPLRYQLVHVPWHLHRPMWRENVDVDLDYHVRPVQVPAPGGRRELDQVIGKIASTPLDRRRPLWELHLAEGLAGQRVAMIGKFHHALADGVASANLMARAVAWRESDVQEGLNVPDSPPSTAQLLSAAVRDHLRQFAAFPTAVRDSAAGFVRMHRRVRARERHPQLARGLGSPATFMNHKLSPQRTFATAALAFAEVNETAKKLDVKINDLVLATVAGGVRELLLRYDGRADKPLIASVPVSTDASTERMSGNAISTLLVSLPTVRGPA